MCSPAFSTRHSAEHGRRCRRPVQVRQPGAARTTNEVLYATVGELEATNEELQCTNEELETMHEELRSMNEELRTINEELRERGESLNDARDILESMFTSLGSGIGVLDRDLRAGPAPSLNVRPTSRAVGARGTRARRSFR
jgi:nitrogen fixation/metabolism regulation signal transduction histidine kinase